MGLLLIELIKKLGKILLQDELLESTSSKFKTGLAEGTFVAPDNDQKKIADFAIKVASKILGLKIKVSFYDSPGSTVRADYYSETNHLRFNVAHINSEMWKSHNETIKQEILDLIIHELGHSKGWHYEHSYHDCLTELGSKLTLLALSNPDWFKI